MKERFEKGADYARDNFSKLDETLPGAETFSSAQSSLSRLFERQPLVLGAIGLAVGAAAAGAFRSSGFENDWVGELSDTVKEDLNKRAGAVSQSVREAADTLKNEIEDAGTETFHRVKQAEWRRRRPQRGNGEDALIAGSIGVRFHYDVWRLRSPIAVWKP